MPIIKNSTYKPFFLYRNNHVNTIATNLFRKVHGLNYKRLRIDTPDKDFIDLDFSIVKSDTIVILTHGLEGNAHREYMKAMVRAVNETHWDAVAINLRGCSDEPNKLYSSYHSGKSDDLDLVVNYIIKENNYSKIFLIGFSLGGNITLKYIGEKGEELSPKIRAAVAISTPCNLKATSDQLGKASNYVYLKRFLRSLTKKAKYKIKRHPEEGIDLREVNKIRDFYGIDNLYTAPAHGFIDAEDYWEKCSCKQFIPGIKIPALLINALDDPFLPDSCYPFKEAEESEYLYFETPKWGGHVGFSTGISFKGQYWHETRVIEFLQSL